MTLFHSFSDQVLGGTSSASDESLQRMIDALLSLFRFYHKSFDHVENVRMTSRNSRSISPISQAKVCVFNGTHICSLYVLSGVPAVSARFQKLHAERVGCIFASLQAHGWSSGKRFLMSAIPTTSKGVCTFHTLWQNIFFQTATQGVRMESLLLQHNSVVPCSTTPTYSWELRICYNCVQDNKEHWLVVSSSRIGWYPFWAARAA